MRPRDKADKNSKPRTHIYKPLSMYFESELEQLHKLFTEKGNTAGLALIEPEMAQRRKETIVVQNQKFYYPKP